MDQSAAIKVLQNYGAPLTPRNLNLVMGQSGSDSAILGRSMGMQGGGAEEGYDDSILKNSLEKLDAASQRTAAPDLVIPEQGTGNGGPVANVAAMRAPTATPIKRSGAAASTEPDVPPQAGATNASPFMPWLLAALGLTSAAGYAGMGPKGGAPSSSTPQLEGPEELKRIGHERKLTGPDAAANEMSTVTGPENMLGLPDDTAKKRLTYQPKLNAPSTQESGVTPQSDAVDKIAKDTERKAPAAGPKTGSGVAMSGEEMRRDPLPNLEMQQSVPVDPASPLNANTLRAKPGTKALSLAEVMARLKMR